MTEEIEILPAGAERWPSLVELVEASTIMRDCWCMWPRRERAAHRPGDPRNREDMKALVCSGTVPGLIAFVSGRAAGWCALGRRGDYPQCRGTSASDVWVLVCLYVADWARGVGVGRRLVEAAVARAAQHGAAVIEGPPPWWQADEGRGTAAAVRLLVAGGFSEVAAGARMPVLRRELTR